MREEDLKQAFEAYGPVTSVKIIIDKKTQRSKGFGFVEMQNDEDAQRAIDALNNSEVMTRKLIVSAAKEPKAREDNQY